MLIAVYRSWSLLHGALTLYTVKLPKGQNERTLSEMDISLEAALENVSEFTEDVLTKTKSILGPYLSTAFGSV